MKVTYAKLLKESPFEEKKERGAKAEGIRYEKKVAKHIKETFSDYEVHHGLWIEYSGREGDERINNVCQPDIVMVPLEKGQPIIVVEVKLSARNNVRAKLERLYTRVVRKIFGGKCASAQVYRNLGESCGPTRISIGELRSLRAGDYAEFLLRL